jgi:glycosyltransferase 2 family protein
MRRHLLFAIKLAVSISLLVYLAKRIDVDLFWKLLLNANVYWASLSLTLGTCMLVVSCWKWWLLMGEFRHKVSFSEALKIYCIGYYFGIFLPSNFGGDFVRSYFLGKKIGNQSASAAGVFLERGSGMVFLLLLVILAPLAQPQLYSHPAIWIPALLAAMLLLGLILLVVFRKPIQRLEDIVPYWIRQLVPFHSLRDRFVVLWGALFSRLRSFYREVSSALAFIRTNPSDLLAVAGTTAAFYGMTWLNSWIAFRIFGVAPSIADVIAVTPAAMLVASLPIAPFGALGLMEASMAGYFAFVGIPPASSTAMALFLRLHVLLVGLAGLFFFLGRKDAPPPAYPAEGAQLPTVN